LNVTENYLTLQRALGKIKITGADLIGLGWLCEQAGMWQSHKGNKAWAKALFRDAQDLRAQAMERS
jgi:hypothetical protein